MPFDNFINEGDGVKSSHANELDNSMKIEDIITLEH
jgi:hypothetical protein